MNERVKTPGGGAGKRPPELRVVRSGAEAQRPPRPPAAQAPKPPSRGGAAPTQPPRQASPPGGPQHSMAPSTQSADPGPTRAAASRGVPPPARDPRPQTPRGGRRPPSPPPGFEGLRLDPARAAAARRHSMFVALMKGLLPSLAIGLVVVFIFYSQGGFTPNLPDDFDFDPGQIDVSGGGIKMVSPKLSGIDDKNQRFLVSAASAVQDRVNPGLVTLESIQAEMQLTEGGWVRVRADGGRFDSDQSLLTLENEIEVTMSSGYVAQLNGAHVDFQKGSLNTSNPVLVFMNAGIISGNAMEILDKGKLVRFSEGVTMTINGNPEDAGEGGGQ